MNDRKLRFLLFTVLPELGNKLLQDATIGIENWGHENDFEPINFNL